MTEHSLPQQPMPALRFLLLEDNPLEAKRVQTTLVAGGINCELLRVETRSSFIAALETDRIDLILADYAFHELGGIAALEIACTLCPDVPFIFVSANLGEERAIEALQRGAVDCVLKQRLERLVPAVKRALQEAQARHDRQKAEQVRERFLAISSDLQMIIGYNHRLQWVSPTFEQTLGWKATEMIGQPWFNFAHPDNIDGLHQSASKGISDNRPVSFENRYRHRDGSYRWFLWNVQKYAEERVIYAVAVDITDRKATEAALRQSEARFRLMVESAKEYAIFTLNFNGIITSWNSGAERLLGYQEAEIIGCNNRIIFTPEDNERGEAERENQTALEHGRAENERWHVRKDGSRFWASGLLMPLQNEAGNMQGFVKILQDRTQSRQTAEREQFLAQSSASLAASIDYKTTLTTIAQLAVPFLADYCFFDVINASGQIERVAWCVADPDLQEWFEQVQQFVPAPGLANHPVVSVLQSGNVYFVPTVTQAWMQSIAINPAHLQFMQRCQLQSLLTVPLKIEHHQLGALTFCFTAYSNRRYTQIDLALAEELARRAALALDNAKLYRQAQEANRIKDEFLAVLSHELRSPLNPILGWTRLLQNGKLDVARQAEALATIERNARLQSQLIEDLLDISRIMQGKLTLTVAPLSLTFVISAAVETVRLAAEAKNLQITLDLDTQIPLIYGDAARLQQVVWNLLTNAIKFTPHNGQIIVELRQLNQLAQIRVVDTGKGIQPQFLPYVFEYFRQEDGSTTRKFGGLGLGLAIVRKVVEMHGGTVKAESLGENQGATFTVQLPIIQQATPMVSEPTPAEVANRETPLSNLQILVVDDDDDTREFQTFLLEQHGARVTAVTSGLEALQTLDRFSPDVIISDIGMAEMDGYMLIQQIRSRAPNQGGQIPAIALTAYARDFDQQKALQAGFQTHMTKPVEPEALVEAIVKLLG